MPLSVRRCRFLYFQTGWSLGWAIVLNIVDRMSVPVFAGLVLVGVLIANEGVPPIGTARTRVRWVVLVLLIIALLATVYSGFEPLVPGVWDG